MSLIGFGAFCFILSFILMVSAAFYTSPFITGSNNERLMLRAPQEIDTGEFFALVVFVHFRRFSNNINSFCSPLIPRLFLQQQPCCVGPDGVRWETQYTHHGHRLLAKKVHTNTLTCTHVSNPVIVAVRKCGLSQFCLCFLPSLFLFALLVCFLVGRRRKEKYGCSEFNIK